MRKVKEVVLAVPHNVAEVFADHGYRINKTLPLDGSEPMTGPLELAVYTVATRPNPIAYPWTVIAVSDGAVGAKIQASNGVAWVNLG